MNSHQFRIIVTLLTMIYNSIRGEGEPAVHYVESESALRSTP